jgi:cytochrome b
MNIRIWDLPTRLFHAAFALTVTGAILSAKLGNAWMDWHVRLGITAFALVLFRIVWGLAGPRYARFSQFVKSPAATWKYLKQQASQPHKAAGHNPLGAWSVIAMLIIIGFQASTGLFANDEILTQGPLAQFVSEASSSLLTGLHQWNETLVYVIVGLHLVAVLIYTLKGQHLIEPMLDGNVPAARLAPHTLAARDDLLVRLCALSLAATLAMLAWWLMQLAANAGSSFN